MLISVLAFAACVGLPLACDRFINRPARRKAVAKTQGTCACGTALPADNPDDLCAQCAAW